MTTMGEFLVRSMKKAPPGIKGTESASLGAWLAGREMEAQEAKLKPLPWYQKINPLRVAVTFGDFLLAQTPVGKRKAEYERMQAAAKPLTSWEEAGLKMRGYSKEDYEKRITLDMGSILESKDLKCTSAEMVDELRKIGYTDREIKQAGVKIK